MKSYLAHRYNTGPQRKRAIDMDPVPYIGPRGRHGGADRPAPGQQLSDDEFIGTWQLFRQAISAVDGSVTTTMPAPAQTGVFYEALARLAAAPDGSMPMTELATAIAMTSGGLTKLVDRLVHAGYVVREHSQTDRRMVYAILTDNGAAFERRTTPLYADLLRQHFGPLRPSGMAALRAICRQLERVATPPSADNQATSTPRRAHGRG